MNAIGAFILSVSLSLILFAPRRWALIGIMTGVLYLTQGQHITVLGFNLFALRFVELAAFFRVLGRGELSSITLNRIDRSFLLLYLLTTLIFLLRSSEGLSYQIGVAVDACLCYFTFRALVSDIDDYTWFLRTFLLLLIPYAILVLLEAFTQYNVFTSMGGIDYGQWMRDGRPRCQGSFRHPSLLGTLGASFIPLYIGLAFSKSYRKTAIFGLMTSFAIVWASNSGGPAGCAAAGIAGWCFWKFRTRMKIVRRGVIVGLVLTALVMKAPIWYLVARVSTITGGSGWHRAYLIDVAFQHLSEWWLMGMPISGTHGWFPYDLDATGGADITNQFLSFGLIAGLVGVGLFIFMLAVAFRLLSKALAVIRASSETVMPIEYALWGLGTMLVAHIFNWLGITYFDQIYAIWFLQLAILSTLSYQYAFMNVPTIKPTAPVDDPHLA